MLRILHSLPRAHKYLLLPVATMVTVLGAHKLLETFDAPDVSTASQSIAIDLASANSSTPAKLPLAIAAADDTQSPLSPAQLANQTATSPASGDIPLAALTPSEIVAIDFDMPTLLTDANYHPDSQTAGPIVALAPVRTSLTRSRR